MAGIAGANYPSSGTVQYAPEIFSLKVLKRFYGTSVYEVISNTD